MGLCVVFGVVLVVGWFVGWFVGGDGVVGGVGDGGGVLC